MAVPRSLCRLCINTSTDDLKSLYDEHGQTNGLYEMTYEYFHPKIVDLEKAKHLTAICLECFRHIHDFHSFQTSVIIAQLKLIEEDKTMYTITEEADIPQSETLTQTMAIKVENEEFIRFTQPDYVLERHSSQIMKEEFITLSNIQIEDSSPSVSKNNHQIIESFSIRGVGNEEDDRKDSISLPTLEITDVDESSTSTTDDARNPPLNENCRSDGVATIDHQNVSVYPPQRNYDPFLSKWIAHIKCSTCSQSFPSWLLLRNHFKLLHPNEKPYYICCSRKFSQVQIRNHLFLHDNPDAFKCSICDKRYINNSNLASHYSESHPETLKFSCEICNKRCISRIGLETHQIKMHRSSLRQDLPDLQINHSPPATNTEMRCISRIGLENQQRKMHSSSPRQDVPDLQINHSPPPTNMDNTETNAPLFDQDPTNDEEDQPQSKYKSTIDYLLAKWIPDIKCFKCSKTFPSWPVLKRHFKRHHPNEKFHYICCSRKFDRSQIKYHLLLHSDPDMFKCSLCDKRCPNSRALLCHYNGKHYDSLKFPCDKCRKRFISKRALVTHQQHMHKSNRNSIADLQIDHSRHLTHSNNNETTERLSIQDLMFHDEDRKDNISLPPLDIMDVDTGSTSTSDDEIPLAQIVDRNPSVSNSLNSDDVVTQTTDDQNSTHAQPEQKHETFEYLLAKWIPNIKCFECSKSFAAWSILKDHFKQEHPNKIFYYICCSRKFSIFRIRDHLLLHDDPEAHTCSICNKHCINSTNLATHYTNSHPGSFKFSCNICNRRCVSKQGLARHYSKIHSSDQQDLPDLQMHYSPPAMKKDNNETTISLSIQDDETPLDQMVDDRNPHFSKRSSSDGVLTQTIDSQKSTNDHPQTNHDSLDYLLAKWMPYIKCFKCSKSFSSWPLVKLHFRKQHPKEKFYYICCSQKFKLSTIKDHLRLHSNPDAFKCLICQKRYMSSRNLATHNATEHTETLRFSCDKCGDRFRSKLGLIRHISNNNHSNRQDHVKFQLLADGRPAYTCQLCGKTKYSQKEFRLHDFKIHGISTSSKVVCTICGVICFTASRFREHMNSHENKMIYKCAFCPRTFRRIRTVRMHRKSYHPLESGENYFINIDEQRAVEDCESAPTVKEDCGEDNPPMSTTDVQESKDNKKMDHTTMAKGKKEDVNTDSETSCDDEIEQEYSNSSASIKNYDCGEECVPTTSRAAAADQQMNENKTKKSHARTRSYMYTTSDKRV